LPSDFILHGRLMDLWKPEVEIDDRENRIMFSFSKMGIRADPRRFDSGTLG
jgi:hypothetical protein